MSSPDFAATLLGGETVLHPLLDPGLEARTPERHADPTSQTENVLAVVLGWVETARLVVSSAHVAVVEPHHDIRAVGLFCAFHPRGRSFDPGIRRRDLRSTVSRARSRKLPEFKRLLLLTTGPGHHDRSRLWTVAQRVESRRHRSAPGRETEQAGLGAGDLGLDFDHRLIETHAGCVASECELPVVLERCAVLFHYATLHLEELKLVIIRPRIRQDLDSGCFEQSSTRDGVPQGCLFVEL